jgi:hypothetical protein
LDASEDDFDEMNRDNPKNQDEAFSPTKYFIIRRTSVGRRNFIWKIPSARAENKNDVLAIREEDHHPATAQS